MLRSTGFFRGIDCPFYSESYNGKIVKNGCNRPYCHFRHSNQKRTSYGAFGDRKAKTCSSSANDDCYDPFNPEVTVVEDHRNEEADAKERSGSPMDVGAIELELVNQAIEAVQCEVEREKRKLSHIGDQEYEPTSSLGAKRRKTVNVTSHQGYDPGSYQMTQGNDYRPTPRSNKYTLDSEKEENNGSSLEYVPTSVSKKTPKKSLLFSPTPRISSNTSSPKRTSPGRGKYTLDTSKPMTDMEYDPLSNFSAKLAFKSKKQSTLCTDAVVNRTLHAAGQRKPSTDEEYVPTVKEPRPPPTASDIPKYSASFSESDGDSSGTEYRPMLISRLQKKKNFTIGSEEESIHKSTEERADLKSFRSLKDQDSVDSGPEEDISLARSEDVEQQPDKERVTEKLQDKAAKEKDNQKRSGKNGDAKKAEKLSSSKSSGGKEKTSGSSSSDKKKVTSDSAKKSERTEDKNRVKDKSIHKSKKEDKSGDGKSMKTEKVKGESKLKEKERNSDIKKHKSDKTQKERGSSKHKDHKNGKLDISTKEKDKSKGSQGSSGSSKERSKKSSSSSSSKETKVGRQKERSLSHVDLFGDESAAEEEEEDEEEDVIVRKSATTHRWAGASVDKKKKVDVSHSVLEDSKDQQALRSSDDEGDYDEGIDDGGVDYSGLLDMVDDADPLEECLRIFNESKDIKPEDKGRQMKQPVKEPMDSDTPEGTSSSLIPGQKKRVSHFSIKGKPEASRAPVVRPYRRPTAQEICYQRMQIAQQQAEQIAVAVKAAAAASSFASSSSATFPGEKKRVAHRPSPSSLTLKGSSELKKSGSQVLSPTRTVPEHLGVKAQTTAGILSKTTTTTIQKRVAHTPTMKSSSMKRPVIPIEFGAKVATGVRQRYLNLFIDECLKVCSSEPEAFQMALDEEQVVYDRSSSKNIYLNVAVNTLKKLRNKSAISESKPTKGQKSSEGGGSGSGSYPQKAQSHAKMLGGRLAATTSFTVNRSGKQKEPELRGAYLYRKLKDYIMTEEQLQEHSYPRPNPEHSGHAIVHNVPEKKNLDAFTKVCCRCGTEYKINVNGSCIRKEECNHHWGRLRRHKVSGGWETSYNCCSGAVGSPGCQVAKQHVQDGRKESLDRYVKTFSKPLPADGDAGVFALDCEMCYTKQGLELTRVTVINSELKVIYDTFVKPKSKVVDYNTRFSGVTEEDLENTTITLQNVQAVLLSMFSAESILIGHSLESDLTALKLIHSTVVDTAIVFPHRLGLPYKRALRNLMADYLKRIIQDNVEGHDSSEDAAACMELMFWKIKEDAKVKR